MNTYEVYFHDTDTSGYHVVVTCTGDYVSAYNDGGGTQFEIVSEATPTKPRVINLMAPEHSVMFIRKVN